MRSPKAWRHRREQEKREFARSTAGRLVEGLGQQVAECAKSNPEVAQAAADAVERTLARNPDAPIFLKIFGGPTGPSALDDATAIVALRRELARIHNRSHPRRTRDGHVVAGVLYDLDALIGREALRLMLTGIGIALDRETSILDQISELFRDPDGYVDLDRMAERFISASLAAERILQEDQERRRIARSQIAPEILRNLN